MADQQIKKLREENVALKEKQGVSSVERKKDEA